MFIKKKGLTFDDVLIVPEYSDILPCEVSICTKLSNNINLNIPLISAPMDTVTDSKLAIEMAKEGGIGIIHKNMSIDKQVCEIHLVKNYKFGFINKRFSFKPEMKIFKAIELINYSGLSILPIVKDNRLIGILNNLDLKFENYINENLINIMTPLESLQNINKQIEIERIKNLFKKKNKKHILIVDNSNKFLGVTSINDLTNNNYYPLANKDKKNRLIVGAAIGVGKKEEERIDKLVDASVDVLIIDTAHGYSNRVLKIISWIKNNYPMVDVVGGNVATADAAVALADAGADAVKVGIGPGSICTTRIISGVGIPQITAIYDVSKALSDFKIPIIADGGIRSSGDISKSIVSGASSCMLGNIFAGTKESTGKIISFEGKNYKNYRGMGSLEAMKKGYSDRYIQELKTRKQKKISEGVDGIIPYKGSINSIIHQMIGGIKTSMGYCGCKNLKEMHSRAKLIEITSSGLNESHVHNVKIKKHTPNYNFKKF